MICFSFSASSHHFLQLDWIFLDHHLILKTRQNPNTLCLPHGRRSMSNRVKYSVSCSFQIFVITLWWCVFYRILWFCGFRTCLLQQTMRVSLRQPSVLNGGHSGYIGRKNLSEMGLYRGYIGDIFKNRMSKSDCKYTHLLVLNRISIRQYMYKLYKST